MPFRLVSCARAARGFRKYRIITFLGLALAALPMAVGANAQGRSERPRSLTVEPSSVDLVVQVNRLLGSCDGSCAIRIPCGNYAVTGGTIEINSPGVSLLGEDRGCVRIQYAGTVFLRRTSAQDFFLPAGKVGGFTLTCSNAQAHCIEAGGMTGFDLEDVTLVGPAGMTNGFFAQAGQSEGLHFESRHDWMERGLLRNVQIGGFQTNVHFVKPATGASGSFGYWLVDGLWTNQGSNVSAHPGPASCEAGSSTPSFGVVIDAGTSVYNTLGWSGQVNSGCTTAADEYFRVGGTFTGVGFHVTGENTGKPVTYAHVLSGGVMQMQGDSNFFGGAVKVDAPNTANGMPSFWVRPTAGLAGVNKGVAPSPVMDWNGSGQPAQIVPAEFLEPDNPAVTAFVGYVERRDGASAPLPVYDARTSFCAATLTPYASVDKARPTWCVDGSGNETVHGTANAAGFAVNGTPGFTGSKKVGACTLVIQGGLIVDVTGC